MRRFVLLLVAAVVGCALPAAAVRDAPAKAKPLNRARASLKITGMTCEGCSKSITIALQRVPGVKSALVEHEKGRGTVLYDPAACKPADMVAAVKKSGYKASVVK